MSKLALLLIFLVALVVGVWFFLIYKTPQTSPILPAGQQQKTITFGILAPLSGNLADYGVELRNGASLAADEINQQGKLKINLEVKDEQGDPNLASKLAQDLSNDKTVLGVVGPVTSTNTLSAGPVFQKNGLTMISPAATNPQISGMGSYIFRDCPSDAQQGQELADFAFNNLKAKKVAVMVDVADSSKAYSQGLANVFIDEFKKDGGQIALNLTYKTGDTDFSTQVTTIKQTPGIDLIFIPGYSAEAALISQELRKQGLKTQVVGGDGVGEGVTNGKVISLGGDAVDGLISTAFFDTKNPDSAVQTFVKDYTARFGHTPSWVAANAYSAMQILASAAEKSQSLDRSSIRNSVAATQNFNSLGRTLSFNSQGDVSTPIIKIVIKNGSYEILQ